MVNGNILQICENGGVTHSVDTLSNHNIIYAVIQDCSSLNYEDDHDDNGCETINSKPAWYKESACDINTFMSNIDNTLPDMYFYNNDCNDTSCVNEDHIIQIDKQFESLMTILLDNSTHIPHTCPPNSSTRVAGWNEFVKPNIDDAIFWKWLHEQVSNPNTGWVVQIMRRTRGQYHYHYALRHVESQKQQVKCLKLLEAMFNCDRDFFKEVHKIRGFNKYDNSFIDGLKDNELIANKFASQYNELFNSNHSDTNDLINMMNGLNKSIKMLKAIKKLKCEKQDDVFNKLASEHFINATELYYEHLCSLFIYV